MTIHDTTEMAFAIADRASMELIETEGLYVDYMIYSFPAALVAYDKIIAEAIEYAVCRRLCSRINAAGEVLIVVRGGA